jgi:predicted transcriptional regulator
MSLSPAKCKILEFMLLNDKSADAAEIAKESGTDLKAARMHLLGLNKTGYTASPAKGQFVLTPKGKQALGVPATTRECAKEILTELSNEKAFHFYAAVDNPLNLQANGLQEFINRLQAVDVASLEFHLNRGDFEKWFAALGDIELSVKAVLLKKKVVAGEELREKLRSILEKRCATLNKIVESV